MKKSLSIILTLCMIASLFAGLGITAGATADDSWVGGESFAYDTSKNGTGWSWNANTGTLTLSGVNAARTDEDGIRISGAATVVLEGANVATSSASISNTSGLSCTGSLTIKGSGTLSANETGTGSQSAVNLYGIRCDGTLKIESGHITAKAPASAIEAGGVEVKGGYVTAESNGNGGNGIYCDNYSQSGGYVKANGNFNGLACPGSSVISGGYLEAKGSSYGISVNSDNTFSNSGGVVKAEGASMGINAIASFTGGVTIAKAAGSSTFGAIYGTVSGSERWWTSSNGVVSGNGSELNGYDSGQKSVVIAKTAQSTQYTGTTADGVYVKMPLGVAWEPTDNATVSGGSYFEGTQNGFYSAQGRSVSINKTLVCIATGTERNKGEGLNTTSGKVTMGADATLYGEFQGSDQKAGITADGGIVGATGATGYDVIGVTSGGSTQGIWAPVGTADKPINGNVIAVNTSTTAGNALAKDIYVGDGGTITAVSAGSGAVLGMDGVSLSVTGTASLTAVSTGTGAAYSGSEITGNFTITGATASTPALAATTFGSNTYKVGGNTATVMFVKGHKDSWVGEEDFNYADATAEGTGWTWNGTSHTLTLSGVNASRTGDDAIHISGTATLVLEGANKVAASAEGKHGVYCSGTLLTIEGSGTLEATAAVASAFGIKCESSLIIDSGHITASSISSSDITVRGGYITAGTSGPAKGISATNYNQHGGYVHALGATAGVSGNGVTVYDGYLEADGTNGIAASTFSNNGGVVKATGTTNGIEVSNTASFTGGVTIAKGTTAISGSATGSEKYWALDSGVPSGDGAAVSGVTGTTIVIAKAISVDTAADVTLDGHYIYSDAAEALNTSNNVTVEGGSYLEVAANSGFAIYAKNITVDSTLVCVSDNVANMNIAVAVGENLTVNTDETLYARSAKGAAISIAGTLTSAGYLIADGGASARIAMNITGGYFCGTSKNNDGISVGSFTAAGGYITGIGTATGISMLGNGSFDCFTPAAVTAIGGTKAYSGSEITGAVTGASAKNIPLSTDFTIESAKVLLVKGVAAPPPPKPTSGTVTTPGTEVIVDGVKHEIGKLETSGNDKTVVVDADKLNEKVAAAKNGSAVEVNIPEGTGKASAQLYLKNIQNMAEKDMNLVASVDDVSYNVHSVSIDTAAILKELGATDPTKVPLKVSIAPADSAKEKIESKGAAVIGSPLEFNITANYEGKTVEIEKFGRYAQRTVEITEEQAKKITTAIVLEANGDIRHVPTEVYQSGGKYFAKINSRTNSVYALIYNEQSFADASGKWYEAVVNEMASRKVINGRNDATFDGDGSITRAEFAAIAVRALGLPENGTSPFTDVKADDWYYGAVGTAYEYGLIAGRDAKTFDPMAGITRQEAMQLIANAAKVSQLGGTTSDLSAFKDAGDVADWALTAAKFNVGSGLIIGSDGKLNPTANITRAETATVVLRLLQNSGLVDVRTKA